MAHQLNLVYVEPVFINTSKIQKKSTSKFYFQAPIGLKLMVWAWQNDIVLLITIKTHLKWYRVMII